MRHDAYLILLKLLPEKPLFVRIREVAKKLFFLVARPLNFYEEKKMLIRMFFLLLLLPPSLILLLGFEIYAPIL